ncbi:MAG: carbon monoxide dehydrogenase [Chloroflexi bacterium 13_1_40CM_4_68_4]|nr:MAG: carbon monoxide dehydrogenase [Chloroflexi bacterium 13_1_40CM_4_68_4]
MIPAAFEYQAPRELAEAIELLASSAGEAKILAGGQSLIPLMKFRLAQPARLIDINRIDGLAYVRANGDLRIGALTREVDLEGNELIRGSYPIIAETAAVIADPLVRNLATVGGNIAHADPANDHPATLLALRASVVARGRRGERVISIDDFFVDTFTTSLQPDEIVVEIRVPRASPRSGGAYLKLERKVGDFAIAGVAAHLTLDAQQRITEAGIGLTNVGPTAIRARRAEGALRGRSPDDPAFTAAAEAAAAESQPVSDLRGPADYKRDVVRVLTMRALRRAAARAKGGT